MESESEDACSVVSEYPIETDKGMSHNETPRAIQDYQDSEFSFSMKSIRRDDRYYFSFIIFQVENCLFKVPRNAFEDQSPIFRDMFAVPTFGREGDNDENPIRLEGIKQLAFRNLLEVLYPLKRSEEHEKKPFGVFTVMRVDGRSQEQWIAVLDLAHMWQFETVRNMAITKLQLFGIDEVQKVEMAHKYEIKEWYAPSYLALAKRAQPLTVVEAARVRYDVAIKIAQVREKRLQRRLQRKLQLDELDTIFPKGAKKVKKGKKLTDIPDFHWQPMAGTEDDLQMSEDVRRVLDC